MVDVLRKYLKKISRESTKGGIARVQMREWCGLWIWGGKKKKKKTKNMVTVRRDKMMRRTGSGTKNK